MLPELLETHMRLGREYGLVPILPRDIAFAPNPERYRAAVAQLDMAALPVLDHFRGTLPVPAEELARGWRATVEDLPPGMTHVALHCTAPGEIEAIAPEHAAWRTNEYALLATGALAGWLADAGVVLAGYRDIQPLWLAICGRAPRWGGEATRSGRRPASAPRCPRFSRPSPPSARPRRPAR